MDQNIIVKIDGTDVTDKVLYPTLNVLSRSFSDSDRAELGLTDIEDITLSPKTEIEVEDNGKKIFGGTLNSHKRTSESIKQNYDLEFTDWSEELRTTYIIEKKYTNAPVTYVILNLFAEYADDFQVIVDDDRTIGEIKFKRQSMMDAIEDFQDDYRLDWFITADKTIYFFKDLRQMG